MLCLCLKGHVKLLMGWWDTQGAFLLRQEELESKEHQEEAMDGAFLVWIAGSYCHETPLLMWPHASKGKIVEGLSL